MAIIRIQLQDSNNSITEINRSNFNLNYIHIKKLIFKDILILNNIEYKYSIRDKLYEDINLLKELEKILHTPTILKFDKYKKYYTVYVEDILLMDSKEHMFPLKRYYNKILKKEWVVVSSRFSVDNIKLYNNDKKYRKKLSTLRSIIKQEYIHIYDKKSLNDFKMLIKNIVKYDYKKDLK